jgi:DNA invertase Pin-like site-specific DNA recombinase
MRRDPEEGRRRAKDRGVKFGRKSVLTQFQAAEALERLEKGESMREIARSYNVSAMAISRLKARTMQFQGS